MGTLASCFQWRLVAVAVLCWGVSAAEEEFEKAMAEIQHDTYHDVACPLWIEMFVQGELAARAEQPSQQSSTTRAATLPGRLLRRRSTRAGDQAHPPPLAR